MRFHTLCYLKRAGQTLMIHRVKKQNDVHEGKWNGLGGKLEQGETPEECALREIREESGLIARNPQLKGLLTFPAFSKGETWYAFVYVVREFAGELIDSQEGNLQWIDDEQLFQLNLWEGDYIFLPWLERPGFFSAKFVYQDGRLMEHAVVFHES